MTALRPAVGRWVGLDRLRGLAVVLMMLDHVLAVTGAGYGLRLSLTRLSLPLFCVCIGALATRPLSRVRLAGWLGALLAALVLYPLAGLPGPLLLLWLLAARVVLVRAPAWLTYGLAVAGVTMATNGWELPSGPGEYAPLGVLVLVLLGRHIGPLALHRVGSRLPSGLEWVGERPLAFYVGHLAVLAWAF